MCVLVGTLVRATLRCLVHAFHDEAVAVDGTAVLFACSPVAIVPGDISPAVAVLSLDISSLVPQVERAVVSACPAICCVMVNYGALLLRCGPVTEVGASLTIGPCLQHHTLVCIHQAYYSVSRL